MILTVNKVNKYSEHGHTVTQINSTANLFSMEKIINFFNINRIKCLFGVFSNMASTRLFIKLLG